MKLKKKSGESGLLSLEACICVTIFIFLMLFMYSFFILFEARNIMAHATLSTANSLALDAYSTSNSAQDETAIGLFMEFWNKYTDDSSPFVSNKNWYADVEEEEKRAEETGGEPEFSAVLGDVIQARFCAYLESSGNTEQLEKLLKRLHIRGGINGLDFSDSKVEGKDLVIKVRYRIDYEYDIFTPDGVEMEHTARSKIWGK